MRTRPWTRRVPRIAAGAAIIACSSGSTGPGSGDVASVEIAPTETTIIVGTTASFHATAHDREGGVLDGRRVFWNSESPEVATVSDAGVVTGHSPGTTRIAASVEGTSALAVVTVQPKPVATVTVSPDNVTLRIGRTVRLEAKLADADGQPLAGRRVDWASTNPGVARVDGSGVVSGIAEGAAVITATSEGKRGTAAVIVRPPPAASVDVRPPNASITVGGSVQLEAVVRDDGGAVLPNASVTWASDNSAVAIVDGSGLVHGLLPGTATITATSGTARGASQVTVSPAPVSAVAVSPDRATLVVGATVQLEARLTDASGNVLTGRSIAWSTSDARVATVSSSGVVTGVSPGAAAITAASEGKSGSAAVTVTPAQSEAVPQVRLSPADTTIRAGDKFQLRAEVTGESDREGKLEWRSSDDKIAKVSGSGMVTGVREGVAVITATIEGGGRGTARVAVLPNGRGR